MIIESVNKYLEDIPEAWHEELMIVVVVQVPSHDKCSWAPGVHSLVRKMDKWTGHQNYRGVNWGNCDWLEQPKYPRPNSWYWWIDICGKKALCRCNEGSWGREIILYWKWIVVTQSCLTLYDPMNCSRPGSSVHGILQAKILERVAIPFSRGSSQPRDWTQVSHIAGGFFTSWATREAQDYWSG